MKIQFLGSTEGVTGSMTLLELPQGKVLIDCGLHQGGENPGDLDREPLLFEAHEIQFVFLTHAHLDHCGYLPKLFKEGFRGNIYATRPTLKLARIILQDSAKLQEESEQHIQNPLYTQEDVTKTLSLFKPVEVNHWYDLLGTRICFHLAGHILGASFIEFRTDKTIIFSGDLGRTKEPFMTPPEPCPLTNALVMESTYGGKLRTGEMEKELHSFIVKISREKRVGIIASFAVARAQLLLKLIDDFFHRHPEEKIPVVIDGPMMKEANGIYQEFLPELASTLKNVEVLEYAGEWGALKKSHGPLIVLSSSGMLTGGRIWRHIKNWQNDPRAVLFLPGFQSPGTVGHQLSEGIRDVVSPDKELIHWQGEVISSDAFSSHADQKELLEWVTAISHDTHIFLLHGEDESKKSLKNKLSEVGFKNISIPQKGEFFSL
jgi:metallo-beta-lactamase family protein